MKIIKQPTYKVIECECGTVFQPEAGDVLYTNHILPCEIITRVTTDCPTCGRTHTVEVKKEKGKHPETCVSCGEIIPEGRQVCPTCETKKQN